MMLLLMMLTATTAWAATVQFPIYSGDEGTSGKPYQIKTIDDLNKLAADVNSGTNYEGKYFKLMNDLDFYEATNTALRPTTAWDDATSQENNYTAIGLYSGTPANCRYFCGHFDGNGMTIRGIRIYSTETSKGFGLFGLIGSGAEVKNVVLDDARIAGGGYSAGIVGWNEGGTIDGCQATAKVAVVGTRPNVITQFLGGIVGRNGINGSSTPDGSTVKNCTSSVTISNIGSEKSRYCGGIAGFNKGTMTDNFVIGANICEASSNDYGAIMGHTNSTGTVRRNYYRDCTVAGVANAIDKGCENSNITADDGAMPVFTLTMGTGITTTTDATVTYSGTSYYVFGKAITLSGGLDNVGSFAPGYTAGYATTSGSVSGNATDGFILTMGYGDATVSASNRYPIDWAMESTGDDADHAYMIYNPEQLDLLAQRVNNGEDYAGKFFKLGANIAYAHKAANEEGADTENNYTAIGNYISSSHPFNGTFLGQNHVVSGIRIYKSGSNSAASRQGLFGYVGKTGVVSNVIVTDARIVGYGQLGVIAGSVFYNSSLSHNYYYNCTVRTATTGIGCNGADITDNDGAVSIHTLTLADGITAEPTPVFTISGTPYYSPGTTITLSYNGTLPTGCIHDYIVTKDGTDPAETVEVAESNGVYSFTMPASNVTNIIQCHTLTVADGITATATPTITVGSTPYYRPGTTVALSYTGTLPEGYGPVYTMTKDGTSDVVTTPGTFSMPASNVTISVTVTDLWGVSADPAADGSADHPYVITNAAGLDLLAQRMNGGERYYGKYFVLMNDIAYPYATDWNAADSQENNFTRIGTGGEPFGGTFDGQGHTISGIRIYSSDLCQGLFGNIHGTVRNVTLADARITGKENVGGIAGANGGTIENCHVTANVLIGATGDNTYNHGGIAGQNHGTVDGCTSSATLSQAQECGGIVGCNENDNNVKNCLAVGVTIYGDNFFVGAIVGFNPGGTLSHNYYSDCTALGRPCDIGCNGADITDNDGAVEATILSDAANVPTNLSGKVAFHRDFTGGKASTVVFPFAYTPSATEGKYYTFGGVTYDGNKGKWIATMNEYTGTTLSANTPYLFVPAGTEAHKPVLFHGEAAASISAGTTTNGDWQFKGVYAEKTWAAADCGRDYGFAATSGKATDGATDVEAGDFVMLAEGAHIKPLRSYLTYTGTDNPWTTTNAPAHRASTGDMPASISVVLVSADGSTTKITTTDFTDLTDSDGAWYTLSGTRLNGKPSAKGLYIHNGLKVVIK